MRGVLCVRKPVRLILVALGLISTVLLAGCGPTLRGGPSRLYSDPEEQAATRSTLAYIKAKYLSEPSDEFRMFYRNYYIGESMKYMNRQYYTYETGLTQDRQKVGLGLGVTSIGLSTAGSLDAMGASKVFSGLAGAVTGVKGQYESEVLFAKTLQIIQAQMRSNRDTIATRIFKGMKLSTLDYPLSIAEADLEDYYGAGTLTAGLLKTAQEVGQQAAIAESMRNNVIEISYGVDDSTQVLEAYLFEEGADSVARSRILDNILKEMGVQQRVRTILYDSSAGSIRADLVRRARARGLF